MDLFATRVGGTGVVSLDARSLEVFRAVAQAGSVTRAADRLNTTQPNVTRLIAALERDCGFRLFARGRYGMALTPPGRILLESVERNFAGLRAIQRTIADLRNGLTGTLWAVALPVLAEGVLGTMLGAFMRANPQVAVNLKVLAPDAVMNAILSAEVDFGTVIGPPPIGVDFEVLPIGVRTMVAVVAPGHRLANCAALDLRDVDGGPIVVMMPLHHLRIAVDSLLHDAGVRAGLVHEAWTQRAVALLVQNSDAIGFVDAEIIDTIPAGMVVPLRIEPETRWSVSLIHRRDRLRSPVFDAFLDWLRDAAYLAGSGQLPVAFESLS